MMSISANDGVQATASCHFASPVGEIGAKRRAACEVVTSSTRKAFGKYSSSSPSGSPAVEFHISNELAFVMQQTVPQALRRSIRHILKWPVKLRRMEVTSGVNTRAQRA